MLTLCILAGHQRECSFCGARGERFSPSSFTALFKCPVCGYTVNADVKAVFNGHFLYLSHLLNAGGKRGSVVSPEVYLKSPQKRAQSKVSLKSNSYVCV
jgi:putative transposase